MEINFLKHLFWINNFSYYHHIYSFLLILISINLC
jgi:hypothetical protein